jgi:hypothetical protein
MSLRRRILLSAGLLAAIVGVALGVVMLLPPRPGVTKANFDRMEKGMPIADVQEILGRFDFDYEPNLILWHAWRADDGAEIVIVFGNGCVVSKSWIDSEETIPDKLRRWLHLPK